MSPRQTLIYGGWLVRSWTHPDDVLENGALCEEGGTVVAIGSYRDLVQRYPDARRVGDSGYIAMPGFVNAHSHGRGLSTFQMGHPDQPLETRIVDMSIRADPPGGTQPPAADTGSDDPYLDTLYSCVKQISSGITTTLHSSAYVDGSVESHAESTRRFVQAYRDSGIRCAYALGIRDRSTLAFADDKEFLATLPPEVLRSPELAHTGSMTFVQYQHLVRDLVATYPEVKFQLGPWNPAFCSDELLRAIAEASQSHGWRIQTHVAETRYQAEFARRKYGKSWARYLLDIGMLTHRFSGAHCVWFDDDDIALMKQSGAQAVHNPGSNLRLQSGVAPVRGFLAAGIPVAFGIDSLGMNDDEDIFQDLRLARLLHGAPGIDGRLIPAGVLLGMATRTGATITGFDGVGQLAEGGPADVVLMSRSEIEGFSADHPIADLVLMRAKPAHIRTVIIGGRILIDEGRWREHAPLRVLEELARSRRLAGSKPSSDREQLKDALRGYLRQMPR